MNVLVAGATGHLGREVVGELQRRGHRVRVLVRRKNSEATDTGFETIVADLTKPESLQGVCDGRDWVFSCAGASMDVNNFPTALLFMK
jgi:uncharacterized protein YbjT (DUF2867 family)